MSLKIEINASRLLVASFGAVILAGAALLVLPIVVVDAAPSLYFHEALFTATSAVCVTGLIVRDTATAFNWLGQLVVLLLIQAGGLGILTFSNVLLINRQHRLSHRQRLLIEQSHGLLPHVSSGEIGFKVLWYTLAIETAGALILALRFGVDYPWPQALWLGVFHSVSAFCNAGFSLFSTSLEQYRDDTTVNATIMALIILGGLGFIVFTDISRYIKKRLRGTVCYLSLHSRMVLITSAALIVVGWVAFIILDWHNPIMHEPWWALFHSSLFLSVTSRTAGFNTVVIGELTNPSLFVLILLMLIGGSPGSTAGGAKTTTAAVITALVISRLRNRPSVEFLNRSIPEEQVSKAMATASAFAALTILGLITIQICELAGLQHVAARRLVLDHLFEVVSALCTVGLSTGVTASLTTGSQLVLTALMFIGRLGPLLIAISLIGQRRRLDYTLPEERINIG